MEQAAVLNQGHEVAGRPRVRSRTQDPQFSAYLRSRRRFIWGLTALMLSVYFGYILTLAYRPDILAVRLQEGQPMTLGIPIGFGMFVFTFSLVAVYVRKANKAFDPAVQSIREGGAQ